MRDLHSAQGAPIAEHNKNKQPQPKAALINPRDRAAKARRAEEASPPATARPREKPPAAALPPFSPPQLRPSRPPRAARAPAPPPAAWPCGG